MQSVSIPVVQVIVIAGTVAGAALVANWRDLVEVERTVTAVVERLDGLEHRIDALEKAMRGRP